MSRNVKEDMQIGEEAEREFARLIRKVGMPVYPVAGCETKEMPTYIKKVDYKKFGYDLEVTTVAGGYCKANNGSYDKGGPIVKFPWKGYTSTYVENEGFKSYGSVKNRRTTMGGYLGNVK